MARVQFTFSYANIVFVQKYHLKVAFKQIVGVKCISFRHREIKEERKSGNISEEIRIFMSLKGLNAPLPR